MDSLVLELQKDALNSRVPVSTLLLKAKAVATKLGLTDGLDWINNELGGYNSYSDVPDYRHISSTIEVWNPYHGWQPVNFDDAELRRAYTEQTMADSMSSLEDLIERVGNTKDGKIGHAVVGPKLALIHDMMPVKLQVMAHISPTALQHIVAVVRERILSWALELESRGVLGNGMSFSTDEKRQAEHVASIHIGTITNMAGSIGGVIDQQVISADQNVVHDFRSVVASFLERLDEMVDGLPDEEVSDVKMAANDVRAALSESEDAGVIKKLLRKIPAAAVSLANFATQAVITAEVAKLLGPSP